jgi:pSer/pThr/pTyr-binding forkhead associated (FHA) protein
MNVLMGIVCGACERLNPIEHSSCEECGNDLDIRSANKVSDEPPETRVAARVEAETDSVELPSIQTAQQEAKEKPMEQARYQICKSCYSPVPAGHKFCGKCGAPGDMDASTDPEYFGDMQVPGKAKLILIKGEGMDGISYHLNSTEHIAGRTHGAILFTEDKWLSPQHANFYYDDNQLMVRDEGSVNGIYLCLHGPINVESGTMFMTGGQLFRVDAVPPFNDEPEADGTYYFASPRRESTFRVVQILEGSGEGIIVNSRDDQVTIGREGGDMNFPNDQYISGAHLKIEMVEGVLQLVDLGSKNGTYVRIAGEQKLTHGDYLFLGRQLLRIEITS